MLHLGNSASRARVEDVLNGLSESLGPKKKQRMDKVFTKRLAPYEPGVRLVRFFHQSSGHNLVAGRATGGARPIRVRRSLFF